MSIGNSAGNVSVSNVKKSLAEVNNEHLGGGEKVLVNLEPSFLC
jgi:hypothetical protein